MKFINFDKDTLSAIGKASVMGLHMVSGILVGGVIGWLLDSWLGTGPWLFVIFFILGVAAGFLNVWRDMKAIVRAQERGDREKAGNGEPDQ